MNTNASIINNIIYFILKKSRNNTFTVFCIFTSLEHQSTSFTKITFLSSSFLCLLLHLCPSFLPPCCLPPLLPRGSCGNLLTVFQARLSLTEVSVRWDSAVISSSASGFCSNLIFSLFTSYLLLFPQTTNSQSRSSREGQLTAPPRLFITYWFHITPATSLIPVPDSGTRLKLRLQPPW